MALSAREMLLIVRAQNQASGALRRVARDVGSLSNLRSMKMRGQQLAIDRQSLQATRQRALNELQSIRTGQRALALERQRANVHMSGLRASLQASGVMKQQEALQASMLRNQAQQSMLGRRVGRYQSLGLSGPIVKETQLRLQAAVKAAKALEIEEQRLAEKVQLANSAIQKQAIVIRELEARQAQATRRAAELASTIQLSTARLAQNAAKMRENNAAINAARWDRVGAAGRIIQHTSRIFQYAGLVIGGSLAYMASSAAKFNTESTLAATQATNKWHQSAAGVMKVSKQIQTALLDMAANRGTTQAMQENQKAVYDIFSSMTLRGSQRQQISQGIDLLKIFNKAAIAGQVDIASVTHAGITILNNFAEQGRQVQQTPRLLQRMFAAVRFGRMTVTEFVGSLNQVAPAFGTAFGRTPQAFDQLSAAMATLTRQMPSVRMAATGLARLTEMFQRPDFVAGLKKSGVQITTATGQLKPFNDIIDMLAKRFPKLRGGGLFLANFFKTMTALGSGKSGTAGTIQGRRALQELILNQKQYHDLSRQVIGDNNEFTKSFQAMSNTSGVKWQLFIQQLHAFAIEIGTAVIPVITQLGKPVMEAVRWFNKLSDSAKSQIGHWAAWGAVILLAGSAAAFLLGTFVRMFAMMGRGIGLLGSVGITILAISAAVSALSGNWDGLNGIIDTFIGFGTGSIAGWVTMLGLAAAAAIKLRGALVMGAGAQAAGGVLGLLGRGRAGATGLKELYQVRRLEGAGRIMSGVAASAAMIPGSLLIAGGAMVAVAAGALIWKHRMEAARKEAEAAAAAMQRVKTLGAAPAAQAAKLGGLAGAAASSEQARINLDTANKAIAAARKKGVGGNALKQLFIDRYNAAVAADQANKKADRLFGGLSGSLTGQANLLRGLAQQGELLDKLRAKRARFVAAGADKTVFASGSKSMPTVQDLDRLDRQIGRVANRMDVLRTSAMKGAHVLATNFSVAVQGLAKLDNLKLSPTVISDMFKFALKKGRMLTLPEIRAFVHAEVSPKALAKVRSDIRAAITGAERGRSVAAGRASIVAIKPKLPKNWTDSLIKSPVRMLSKIVPPKNVAAVHSSVAKVFRKNIIQRITISPGPAGAHARGVAIGAALAQGAKAGIDANTQAVINAAVNMVEQANIAARAHIQSKSPSRLFADTVGKPIGQGIALGILETRGDITKAAMLTIDLFQGTILSNYDTTKATKLQLDRAQHSLTIAQAALRKHATESNRQRVEIARENMANLKQRGRPITAATLTRDLSSQLAQYRKFNTGIATLTRRGAPKALIEQLASLGVEGADNIKRLANMSRPQLQAYVKLWKQAQKEITRSARYTQSDVTAALKSLAKDAAQSLFDTYNSFKDTNTQNFGNLFEGSTGLSDKVGKTFQDALDAYNSSLADYQAQLGDLGKQLQAVNQQAFDDMAATFGPLFSGTWLTGSEVQTKLDWGQKLGFDDLFKDLQSQVDRFAHWRKDLSDLAGKVPADLAKQLEALGPDATSMLDILNSATGDQLAQYIALWQQAQGNIGTAATQALTGNSAYVSQINDIMTQIADVNKKINELVAPTALTSGDLTKDIDSQIAAWGEYQGTLDTLIQRGLPAELVLQLSQMGPQAEPYLKALATMTDDQLMGKGGFVDKWKTAHNMITTSTNTMMGEQLKLWYSYGANAAAQLIAGVSSEQQPLIDYFTSLFKNLLTGQTPNFTPPGTGGGAGSYGDDALGRYLNNTATSTNTTNVNMEVNAHHDESLQTTMERATFRLTQRNPQ